jgi:predicted membrane channel-forming protein YqfA (hemolysin III family)
LRPQKAVDPLPDCSCPEASDQLRVGRRASDSAGLALLFVSSYLPTINVILQDSITAIGFQICFYLGLTGLACAWYYRSTIGDGMWRSVTHVIWPAFSGLFLFFIALYSIPTFDTVTNVVGMGGIAIGAIPLLLNRRKIWKAA